MSLKDWPVSTAGRPGYGFASLVRDKLYFSKP